MAPRHLIKNTIVTLDLMKTIVDQSFKNSLAVYSFFQNVSKSYMTFGKMEEESE